MTQYKFSKLLVANRGEIACRVIEGARKKGYRTVAVFSEADAHARHVSLADEAVLIGPAPVGQSYLSIEKIIDAAKRTGADAIHPGYGFLSENEDFAEACEKSGIIFVGPSAKAIEAMGNKAAAKRLMIEAGVPCVPGYQGKAQDDEIFVKEAKRIGYPVMVKAAAGGGGRGMRLVHDAKDLKGALASARSEATNAFGSPELILEKAVVGPRHVEIQVMADRHGNAIHLGERDCSVQRRHQKVLEEAPCPVADEKLRAAMGDAAVKAAQSINYVGAGTVEFLLDKSGEFYFLEMNTRLQVEHPVTECVTGVDLVAMQLDVAAGLKLPISQAEVRLTGHAIEARLYAEDPANNFLPQTGPVLLWHPADGDGIRIDHGVVEGNPVSPFYDPMLAKVIAYGSSREEARRRLIHALHDTSLLGVTTNKGFLIEMLAHPGFADGSATTAFIGDNFPDEKLRAPHQVDLARMLAATILVDVASAAAPAGFQGWWSTGQALAPVKLAQGDEVQTLTISQQRSRYDIGGTVIDILSRADGFVRFLADGREGSARYAIDDTNVHVDFEGRVYSFEDKTYAPAASKQAGSDGIIRAPMSGRIVSVSVKAGDNVEKGQLLAVLEAMKMEHQLKAVVPGKVENVSVVEGAQVESRQVLVTMVKEEAPAKADA